MIIKIQDSARRDLKKIDNTKALNLLKHIKKLERYPDIANIKKLKNHSPPMRYRVGNYRILFDVIDDTLIIVNIKHRKEGKHPVNHRGSGGKKYDSFQPVMNLIFFPPVEDNLVSTELSPVKGVNWVLTKEAYNNG